MLSGLDEHGYAARCMLLLSSDYYLPQRRKRLYIIGLRRVDLSVSAASVTQSHCQSTDLLLRCDLCKLATHTVDRQWLWLFTCPASSLDAHPSRANDSRTCASRSYSASACANFEHSVPHPRDATLVISMPCATQPLIWFDTMAGPRHHAAR